MRHLIHNVTAADVLKVVIAGKEIDAGSFPDKIGIYDKLKEV